MTMGYMPSDIAKSCEPPICSIQWSFDAVNTIEIGVFDDTGIIGDSVER